MSVQRFDSFHKGVESVLPPEQVNQPYTIGSELVVGDAKSVVQHYFPEQEAELEAAYWYEMYAVRTMRGVYGYVTAFYDKQANMLGVYALPMWNYQG